MIFHDTHMNQRMILKNEGDSSTVLSQRNYGITYCCNCLVLFLFFNLRNALDSICLILSLLTPISSPISCNVFILPSSRPNLHVMTCFSLGFKLFRTLVKSCLINCLMSNSSAVSASGSAITSWRKKKKKKNENHLSWH